MDGWRKEGCSEVMWSNLPPHLQDLWNMKVSESCPGFFLFVTNILSLPDLEALLWDERVGKKQPVELRNSPVSHQWRECILGGPD